MGAFQIFASRITFAFQPLGQFIPSTGEPVPLRREAVADSHKFTSKGVGLAGAKIWNAPK